MVLAEQEEGTAMTETARETTLTEVLVRHAIYQHNGVYRIAIDDNTLQDLTGSDTYSPVVPGQVTIHEEPGSPEWVDRMARVRKAVIANWTTTRANLDDKINHLDALGQAILEQANERDWCEEYDSFAEEWGLPTRSKEYEVIVTVRVMARSEEGACEFVGEKLSLDYSNDEVTLGPDFSASEC